MKNNSSLNAASSSQKMVYNFQVVRKGGRGINLISLGKFSYYLGERVFINLTFLLLY